MKTSVLTIILGVLAIGAFAQSDSANHYYKLALAEKNNRRFAQAYNLFQKSLQFNTENADVQADFGFTAIELRKYDAAKLAFQKVLALKKDDPIALENLASISFWQRRWNEAIP